MQCDTIEVVSVEESIGYPCGNYASAKCCDCDAYGENCKSCSQGFSSTCLAYQTSVYHQNKPAGQWRKTGLRPRQ